MKATIYATVILLAGAAIAYLIYGSSQEKAAFVPTGDFARDDQRLYELIRADLQQYTVSIGSFYGAWMDDLAYDNYTAGTYKIAGQNSKAASFVAAAVIHYSSKRSYYNQLINNLKARYQ